MGNRNSLAEPGPSVPASTNNNNNLSPSHFAQQSNNNGYFSSHQNGNSSGRRSVGKLATAAVKDCDNYNSNKNNGTVNWRPVIVGRGGSGEKGSKRSSRNSPHTPGAIHSSSAASSSSAGGGSALGGGLSRVALSNGNASAPSTPRDEMPNNNRRSAGGGTSGGGFLSNLFHSAGGTLGRKGEHKKKAAASQLFSSTPLSPKMQQKNGGTNNSGGGKNNNRMIAPSSPVSPPHEHFQLLPDRPAIRLDSRLVCKYEVLSVVGKGSFSQVLRVRDRITKRYFAVKLVSVDQDFGAVNNELSILGRVKHPFVIRLEEVFRSTSKLFIVMEMASGGEMFDRVVAKGRYTEGEARLAIKMLLNGLDYLHRNFITHRDLKPENLLYSDSRADARLLITDFGLAKQTKSAEERMTETCGTPEYIAPEILLRIPYTNKVDCWAVGVIAYILMSGIMPFDDDCRSRLYTHIITANYIYYPQFWSGSEQAKHFVDSLLETSPEFRPSAQEALQHHWVTGERQLLLATCPEASRRLLANDDGGRSRGRRRDWDGGDVDLIMGSGGGGGLTSEVDTDCETNVNGEIGGGGPMQRTKSSRSVRSVTRSDHGHRVDPREVDQLAEDLQRLARQQYNNNHSSTHNGGHHHNQHHHHHHSHSGSSSSHRHSNSHHQSHQQQQHYRSNGGHNSSGRLHPQSGGVTPNGQQQQQITKNYGIF